MDATAVRQQRGLEIAARCRIEQRDGAWVVPSQSGSGRYAVVMSARGPRCTCPDHETRGLECKHIYAVRCVIDREQNPDGSTTVTKTVSVTETVRRTYPQQWAKYNAAQTTEKDRFLVLLHDLCRGVPEPQGKRNGRPRLSLADAIFSAAFKVYSTVSAPRFMSDLHAAHAQLPRPLAALQLDLQGG